MYFEAKFQQKADKQYANDARQYMNILSNTTVINNKSSFTQKSLISRITSFLSKAKLYNNQHKYKHSSSVLKEVYQTEGPKCHIGALLIIIAA